MINARQLHGLAQSVTIESGFVWTIWTENAEAGRSGGICRFADEQTAHTYLDMHQQRLEDRSTDDIRALIFDINDDLTAITHGPVETADRASGQSSVVQVT